MYLCQRCYNKSLSDICPHCGFQKKGDYLIDGKLIFMCKSQEEWDKNFDKYKKNIFPMSQIGKDEFPDTYKSLFEISEEIEAVKKFIISADIFSLFCFTYLASIGPNAFPPITDSIDSVSEKFEYKSFRDLFKNYKNLGKDAEYNIHISIFQHISDYTNDTDDIDLYNETLNFMLSEKAIESSINAYKKWEMINVDETVQFKKYQNMLASGQEIKITDNLRRISDTFLTEEDEGKELTDEYIIKKYISYYYSSHVRFMLENIRKIFSDNYEKYPLENLNQKKNKDIFNNVTSIQYYRVRIPVVTVYRGSENFKWTKDIDLENPYSISFGDTLFSGMFFDHGACAWSYYFRYDKKTEEQTKVIFIIPFNKILNDFIFIPPVTIYESLALQGELFHPRTYAYILVKEINGNK